MGELKEETDLAFVLSVDRKFSYEQRPRPKPTTSHDVVVRVIATGICGSDVSYWPRPQLKNC